MPLKKAFFSTLSPIQYFQQVFKPNYLSISNKIIFIFSNLKILKLILDKCNILKKKTTACCNSQTPMRFIDIFMPWVEIKKFARKKKNMNVYRIHWLLCLGPIKMGVVEFFSSFWFGFVIIRVLKSNTLPQMRHTESESVQCTTGRRGKSYSIKMEHIEKGPLKCDNLLPQVRFKFYFALSFGYIFFVLSNRYTNQSDPIQYENLAIHRRN